MEKRDRKKLDKYVRKIEKLVRRTFKDFLIHTLNDLRLVRLKGNQAAVEKVRLEVPSDYAIKAEADLEGQYFQHLKTGGVYRIEGFAHLQVPDDFKALDNALMVIYVNDQGLLFTRPAYQFFDGRFAHLPDGKLLVPEEEDVYAWKDPEPTEPSEPGAYSGDLFYGYAHDSTKASHEWLGLTKGWARLDNG